MIPLAAFDTETTGPDPLTARIVQAALVLLDAEGGAVWTQTWLVNPGVPIPAEATAIHGITDEQVQEHGDPAAAGVLAIAETLASFEPDMPLVIFNAPYDLTVLDREIRRHGLSPLAGDEGGDDHGLWWSPRPIIDPLVIDKQVDRYRKGGHRLENVAPLHDITIGHAHDATADATAAGRIAQSMIARPALRGYTRDTLHDAQERWYAEQSEHYADWLRGQQRGPEADQVSTAWPVRWLDHE